jgi:integrase
MSSDEPSSQPRRRKRAGRRPFGRVRTLPSGHFQARYLGPDGRERSAGTFTTKREADAALAKARTELGQHGWKDPQRGQQKVADYAARWIAERDLRPRTREVYEAELLRRIEPRLGRIPLADLTREHVASWHSSLLSDLPTSRRGSSGVARAYRLLHAICATAVDHGHLVANPCSIKGAGKSPEVLREPPDVADVWRLAGAVPDRYRVFVLMAASLGLRHGELAALRRRDVDLVRRTVRVERQYVEPTKGDAYFGPPKTQAGTRTLPIPEAVIGEIEQRIGAFSAAGRDGLVFTDAAGGPISRNNRWWWHRALEELELDSRTRLHDLRHGGLTLAATAGATLRELMSLAGHSSPRAAMLYQHASERRREQVAAGVSALFAAAAPPPNSNTHVVSLFSSPAQPDEGEPASTADLGA